jgi:hypothetical protein
VENALQRRGWYTTSRYASIRVPSEKYLIIITQFSYWIISWSFVQMRIVFPSLYSTCSKLDKALNYLSARVIPNYTMGKLRRIINENQEAAAATQTRRASDASSHDGTKYFHI